MTHEYFFNYNDTFVVVITRSESRGLTCARHIGNCHVHTHFGHSELKKPKKRAEKTPAVSRQPNCLLQSVAVTKLAGRWWMRF